MCDHSSIARKLHQYLSLKSYYAPQITDCNCCIVPGVRKKTVLPQQAFAVRFLVSLFQKDVIQLAHIVTSQQNPSFDQRKLDYLQAFGVTGCISVFQKWLQDGMIESPTEMTEFILQVLYQGITSFQSN